MSEIHAIIDSNGIFAQSWYAAFSASDLDPCKNTADIFCRSVSSIFNRLPERPTHALFCWDGGQKRDKGRAPKPGGWYDAMQVTQDKAKEIFAAAHIIAPVEADDACATAAYKSNDDDRVSQVYVISGDKDLQQLIGEKIDYYSINDKTLLARRLVLSKWKVKKHIHIAIALAIIGDSADAIKGVHKWGAKKVEKLFEQVSDDMTVDKVVDVMLESMNEEQRASFLESLELTLLDVSLDNIPRPAEIIVGDMPLMSKRNFTAVSDANYGDDY